MHGISKENSRLDGYVRRSLKCRFLIALHDRPMITRQSVSKWTNLGVWVDETAETQAPLSLKLLELLFLVVMRKAELSFSDDLDDFCQFK